MTTLSNQHPTLPPHPLIVYQQSHPNVSKSDIEKKLLERFGIKTSILLGVSISVNSPLFQVGNKKLLLDHLYQLNMVLNNPNFEFQRQQILDMTEGILRNIFTDTFNPECVQDLHYLMSHRNKSQGDVFPRHAEELRKLLVRDVCFVQQILDGPAGNILRSVRVEENSSNTLTKYQGNTLNEKAHGIGVEKNFSAGYTHSGYWIEGRACGPGIREFFNENGEIVQKVVGVWNNGLLDGHTIIENLTEGWKYEGKCLDYIINGEGRITWPDGSYYCGSWTNGYQHGGGKIEITGSKLPPIESQNWSRGCLPMDDTPLSQLDYRVNANYTRDRINLARAKIYDLINKAPRMQIGSLHIPQGVFPRLQNNRLAYSAAIDPEVFNNDPKNRTYGPNMFDGSSGSDPCNGSRSYLHGFFGCACVLSECEAKDLTLCKLRDALAAAFPAGYLKFNMGLSGCLPNGALLYYQTQNSQIIGVGHYIKYGLWYPLERVTPYSNCAYRENFMVSHTLETEEDMNHAFEQYKTNFLSRVEQAAGDKNQIKAAIILLISQIEVSHFFNNGNTRLCSQILLNKLLVEYKVYDDNLGSILYIPNGFVYYALSHLNHFLIKNKQFKNIDDCNNISLQQALESAILWVDFGHECYEVLVNSGHNS